MNYETDSDLRRKRPQRRESPPREPDLAGDPPLWKKRPGDGERAVMTAMVSWLTVDGPVPESPRWELPDHLKITNKIIRPF